MPNPFKKRPTRPKASAESAGAPASKKPRRKGVKRAKPKKAEKTLSQVVGKALDDLKADAISVLDVRHLTTVTDTMIVASGRSDRHVRSIGSAIVEQCKRAGFRPIGVEGVRSGEWVLVDLGDLVVHVMLPRVREFYNLEKLWDLPARAEDVASAE